jgi:hypothetical protein
LMRRSVIIEMRGSATMRKISATTSAASSRCLRSRREPA